MTDTRGLIDQLSVRARPVRPLASPLRRTLQWLVVATLVIAVVAGSLGLRRDLFQAMSHPAQVLEFLGGVLTGVAAAYAAFQVSVPGRSPSWAWLPLFPATLWLGGIGWGCVADVARLGMPALAFQTHSGECARAILVMSLPLALAMVLMVRHAGVVRPGPTAMLAMLSAAALCSAGVSLIHSGESMLMTLVWHLGMVGALALASLALGPRVFGWVGYATRRRDGIG